MYELLQALAVGAHIAKHVALTIIERAQFLALQQLDISVQNRKGSLEIVGRRSQGVGGAQKPFAKLRIFLQQLVVAQGVRCLWLTGRVLRIRRGARYGVVRNTRIFWR